jgi:eukaryotic-like serine/threonine-protein kinase
LRGFAPEVRRLGEVSPGAGGRVEVRLVDELPGYRVEPAGADGPVAADVPARGTAEVHLVLQQTPAGWRISDAQVEP